jgi:hypothetical protein
MKTLKYSINFSNGLRVQRQRIIRKVEETLSDKRGWTRMGYKFVLIEGKKESVDFTIQFVSNSYVERICNFTGLSCADTNTKTIYMNIYNWRNGRSLSGLNTDDYRTYMINHEVGHILGRGHLQCGNRGTRVPVMVQQTLGIGDCRPNPWPLSWE